MREKRRRTQVAVAVFAATVLSLAGCSADDDGGGSSAEPTDSAVSTTASPSAPSAAPPTEFPTPSPPPSASDAASASRSPSPVPSAGPERKLVTMTVSGGFAGVQQEVVLRGDGTVRTSDKARDKGRPEVRRTSAAQFTQLRTLLGDPALDDVPDLTVDPGAADLFQYTLRFDGRTVITDRSAGQPALDRLIDALGKWLPTR